MSSLMEELMDEGKFDRIQAYYRKGEIKVVLSADDEEYLERIERIRDIWLVEKDEVMTRNKVILEYGVSQRTAYNLIADAKRLWALSERFDYGYELAMHKKLIDSTLDLARKNEDAGMMHVGLKAHADWMKRMREYLATDIPDEPKHLQIVHHNDHKKLGISDETMAEWNHIIETQVLPKLRKGDNSITDVEYEDVG